MKTQINKIDLINKTLSGKFLISKDPTTNKRVELFPHLNKVRREKQRLKEIFGFELID